VANLQPLVYEHAGPPPLQVLMTMLEPSPAEMQCKVHINRNELWAVLDVLFMRKPGLRQRMW
jgi:hypothetical protein